VKSSIFPALIQFYDLVFWVGTLPIPLSNEDRDARFSSGLKASNIRPLAAGSLEERWPEQTFQDEPDDCRNGVLMESSYLN